MVANAPRFAKSVNIFFRERFPIYGNMYHCTFFLITLCCILSFFIVFILYLHIFICLYTGIRSNFDTLKFNGACKITLILFVAHPQLAQGAWHFSIIIDNSQIIISVGHFECILTNTHNTLPRISRTVSHGLYISIKAVSCLFFKITV